MSGYVSSRILLPASLNLVMTFSALILFLLHFYPHDRSKSRSIIGAQRDSRLSPDKLDNSIADPCQSGTTFCPWPGGQGLLFPLLMTTSTAQPACSCTAEETRFKSAGSAPSCEGLGPSADRLSSHLCPSARKGSFHG